MIQWRQARHRTPSDSAATTVRTTGKMSTNVPHNVGTISSNITAQATLHTLQFTTMDRPGFLWGIPGSDWISLTKIRAGDVTTPTLLFVTFHESLSFTAQFSYMKLLLTNYADALNIILDWVTQPTPPLPPLVHDLSPAYLHSIITKLERWSPSSRLEPKKGN